MTVEFSIARGAGHPWDGRPGFDLMEVAADTRDELEAFARTARTRFWEPWLLGRQGGTGRPGGVLYKPSGIREHWHDSGERPHPGGVHRPS